MNKPVQWKVTSFLVGSSDETALFSVKPNPLLARNISGDPTYGHKRLHVRVHMLDHRKYFLANKGFGLRKQRCFVR